MPPTPLADLLGLLLAVLAAGLLSLGTGVQAHSRSQRTWWAGTALLGVGSTLGALALALAPVALVQPVGVLALPLAVAWAVRRGPGVPSAAWAGVAACVLGVGLVVVLLALDPGTGSPAVASGADLAGTGALLLGLVAVGAAVGSVLRPGPGRVVLLAATAGTAFGTVAVLTRLLLPPLLIGRPPAAGAGLVLLLALGLGLWSLRLAGAERHHGLLVATLTVVDPLVAVALATVLLGETLPGGPLGAAATAAALLGVLGVALLARTNTAPRPRTAAPAPQPSRRGAGDRRAPTLPTDGVLA